MVKVGLINNRHPMPVQNYIFEKEIENVQKQMKDFLSVKAKKIRGARYKLEELSNNFDVRKMAACMENEEQEERCHKMGISDVKQILTIDDLVKGDDVMFTASGITNCDLLHGVNFFGNGARTHTISMRYATGTVRFVDAVHTFDRSNINIKL